MAIDPQDMSSVVDTIASKVLGVPPEQASEPKPEEKSSKDSPEGEAAEKGSPDTEGDKVAAEAVIYEIEWGKPGEDGEQKTRKLTPEQIKSTFDRYSALNYDNAQYKPVMDVIRQYIQANPGMSPNQLADTLQNLAKADQHNPTMGNTDGDKSGDYDKTAALEAGDMDAILAKWEEDNAASLPPGYKEMLAGGPDVEALQRQLAQTQQMVQQLLGAAEGTARAAKEGNEWAQGRETSAIRQTIANNIDKVQAALNLPDDKANDFMVFAAERGYTMEDFVDPQLTIKVMQDFKNNMDSPEMERMLAIAQRRQAYTGSLGSTPSASPSTEMAEGGGSTLDRLTSSAMARRGIA